MYMREMGSVELLTREGEIEIAKRIEEGTRELMAAVADWPSTVAAVIAEYEKVEAGERKLTDIISRLPQSDGARPVSTGPTASRRSTQA